MHIFSLFFIFLTAFGDFELGPGAAVSKWSGQAQVAQQGTDSEYLKFTTVGNGEPGLVSWEFKDPVDMEKHFVQAYINISSFESWQSLELRLSSDNSFESYIAIPIAKYTDPNFNWIAPGQWARVTFALGEGQIIGTPNSQKIKYLSWYINDPGTPEKPVTPFSVSLSGVSLAPAQGQPLLSITFDDGYAETLLAAKIMAQKGLRGTAYIIPDYIGKVIKEDTYLTLENLTDLYKNYRWGISAHHQTPFDSMSPGRMNDENQKMMDYLTSNGFSFSAAHLAYPLGKTNSDILNIAGQFYKTARIAGGGGETLPPADWRRLRTLNMTPAITAEILAERIKKAQAHNEWLILMFHRFTDGTPATELHYNTEEFNKVIKVISDSNITTLPVHEVWETYRVD